jgi:hypothetical protein
VDDAPDQEAGPEEPEDAPKRASVDSAGVDFSVTEIEVTEEEDAERIQRARYSKRLARRRLTQRNCPCCSDRRRLGAGLGGAMTLEQVRMAAVSFVGHVRPSKAARPRTKSAGDALEPDAVEDDLELSEAVEDEVSDVASRSAGPFAGVHSAVSFVPRSERLQEIAPGELERFVCVPSAKKR